MKKLHVNIIFPNNIYSLRKVKVKNSHNKTIARIPPNNKWIIEIPETEKEISFSLDFYKTQILLNSNALEEYCIIYFNYRRGIAGFIDQFRFDCFKSKLVTFDAYQNTSIVSIYNASKLIKKSEIDWLPYIMALFLSVYTCIHSFVSVSNMSGITFLLGTSSLISLMYLFVNIKNISEHTYHIRMIIIGLTFLVLSFNIDLQFLIYKFLYLFLSLVIVAKSTTFMVNRSISQTQ